MEMINLVNQWKRGICVSIWFTVCYGFIFGLTPNHTYAQTTTDLPVLKVGVLKFGTINWQMDVIKHHKLDILNNFKLEVRPFASKNASAVALQSGAVDIIMTDLFWVSRQRSQGKPYVLMPTVKATGGVYTATKSTLASLFDGQQRSIGVAGGSVDKNWLLLKAYAKHQGFKLSKHFKPKFAAPPLLNRFMLAGELDASINFWHYNSRLEAAGMHVSLPLKTMLSTLGINNDVPLLGWVFEEQFATESAKLLKRFMRASFAAKRQLSKYPSEWERIAHLIKAENNAVLQILQSHYPNTLLTIFTQIEVKATQQLFEVYQGLGGHELLGQDTSFDPNIYWSEAKQVWQNQQ